MLCRLVLVVVLVACLGRNADAGRPISIPFDGPGTLIQGVECVLFAADSGGVFVYNGEGSVGDYLWVTGSIITPCVSFCQQGDGCLSVREIGPAYKGCGTFGPAPQSCTYFHGDDGQTFLVEGFAAGPFDPKKHFVTAKVITTDCFPVLFDHPGLTNILLAPCTETFTGCGVIKEGVDACPLVFVSDELFNGKPKVMTLETMGNFGLGDHVLVKGELIENCYENAPFFCPADCLVQNTIGPCDQPQTFEGCGVIVQFIECGWGLQTDDAVYLLDSIAPFNVGDTVFAKGIIVPDCKDGTIFCDEIPCLKEVSLSNCLTFWGCGTLGIHFECGNSLLLDDGTMFLIDSFGDFEIGDTVFAEGVIDFSCSDGNPFCEGIPCLLDVTLKPCSKTFAGCGTLFDIVECGLGFAAPTGETFLLENAGEFQAGDVVFVSGTIEPNCTSPVICGSFDCLNDNVIGKCFDECGTLVQGIECILFQSGSGTYALDTIGTFQVGDQVRVQGIHDPTCTTFCQQGNGCIHNNTIEFCEQFQFSGCGTLQVGPQSCTLFVPDEGEGAYILQDEGGFQVGDHVFVTGPVVFTQFSCFPLNYPVILNKTIKPCKVPQPFAGCGTIVALPFCGLSLKTDADGAIIQLNDVGDFEVGDHVFVKGTFIDPCFVIPECSVGACLDVELIEECGVSWFSGCGFLTIPLTCDVSLVADDGSGLYQVTGPLATELPNGTHIFIQGPIDTRCPSGLGDCPCVEVVSWSVCDVPADLDEDGDVDGADLGLLLGAWGDCGPFQIGCLGDINCDGLIDGADLGLLLGAWTG